MADENQIIDTLCSYMRNMRRNMGTASDTYMLTIAEDFKILESESAEK